MAENIPFYNKWWFWVIVLIMVSSFIGYLYWNSMVKNKAISDVMGGVPKPDGMRHN